MAPVPTKGETERLYPVKATKGTAQINQALRIVAGHTDKTMMARQEVLAHTEGIVIYHTGIIKMVFLEVAVRKVRYPIEMGEMHTVREDKVM